MILHWASATAWHVGRAIWRLAVGVCTAVATLGLALGIGFLSMFAPFVIATAVYFVGFLVVILVGREEGLRLVLEFLASRLK